MEHDQVDRHSATKYSWTSIQRIILLFLCLSVVACASRYTGINTPYVPGSNLAAKNLIAAMTPDEAVALLGKYIDKDVYESQQRTGSANHPLAQALASNSGKPTVTTDGFTYVLTSTGVNQGKMTVNMARKEVKFADVTHIEIYSVEGEDSSVSLYDRQHAKVLSCHVRGSSHLVPKLLASIEKLCPNLVVQPMVKDFSCCRQPTAKGATN